MINGYTESEICMLYRQARNKKLQIEILSQLTGLRSFEVEKILENGGYTVAKKNLEMRERIKELHAQNLTVAEIAKELKTVNSNIHRYLKILNLKPNIKEEVMEKVEQTEIIENLKAETQKNYEELKEILPKSIPRPYDIPIDYEVVDDKVETLTPQQYYELAKITLELLKTIWE